MSGGNNGYLDVIGMVGIPFIGCCAFLWLLGSGVTYVFNPVLATTMLMYSPVVIGAIAGATIYVIMHL